MVLWINFLKNLFFFHITFKHFYMIKWCFIGIAYTHADIYSLFLVVSILFHCLAPLWFKFANVKNSGLYSSKKWTSFSHVSLIKNKLSLLWGAGIRCERVRTHIDHVLTDTTRWTLTHAPHSLQKNCGLWVRHYSLIFIMEQKISWNKLIVLFPCWSSSL